MRKINFPVEIDPQASRKASRKPSRWLMLALLVCLPLAAAACGGSSRSADQGAGQAGASEDEDYPNLARVPGEQPRPTPASLRKELIDGLAADRSNARYTGEPLTAASAAVPPAAPPPAAKPQVEIIWETLRVLPEDEAAAESGESGAASGAEGTPAGAASAGAAAGLSEAAADGAQEEIEEGIEEEVEINWETERVEPSGKIAAAGQGDSEEQLILAPGPELVAVVYFAHDSDRVDTSDRALLEDVVALYKERGGRLRLVGHASSQASTDDEVAQRMVNLDLSLKRANAVATTLLDLGAEKDKLMIEAKADSELLDGETLVDGEGGNRRVEVFLEH